MEINILLELAKKLNMSIEMVLDIDTQWGELYPNFTGDGILGNLGTDRTDIGFGIITF